MDAFLNRMKTEVAETLNDIGHAVTPSEVFVVWSCKTLQHKKALLGAPGVPYYFEATFNGDRKETYLDCYAKKFNVCLN